MEKQKYSAVVLAKNDESTIGACIEALLKITDDIVVILDERSSDKTEAIVLGLGAKVFKKEWIGYSANKNFGIDQTRYDWIICPDADEVLDEKLIAGIKALKPQSDKSYEMNRLTYFGDYAVKHCGWLPDWNIRLFNKHVMRWNNNGVHEVLESKSPVKLEKISGLIHHYSFRDEKHMKEKYDNYARLRAEEWIAANKKPPLIKRLVGPEFRFFRTYLLKMGILDGQYGRLIAKNEYLLKKKELTYWHNMMQYKKYKK